MILAVYLFISWLFQIINPNKNAIDSFSDINNIFFEQFFTVLIFADVLLLLFSIFLNDEFHNVIRNSGFIISTILIRISFSITGLLNNLLILSAITFGLLIIIVHIKFEKQMDSERKQLMKSNG